MIPVVECLPSSTSMFMGHTIGHFTFWISLSLRPKSETKRLNFGLPELRFTSRRSAHHFSLHNVIADVIGDSSQISPYFFVYFRSSEKVK